MRVEVGLAVPGGDVGGGVAELLAGDPRAAESVYIRVVEIT